MRVLAGSLQGATKVKDSQGSCRNLSKLLVLGTKYRLFFPVATDEHGDRDILLAAVPGRKLDYNKLKRSFIALDDFDQSDSGRIVDKSGLTPYAKIAKVLFQADCAREKEAAKVEAKNVADQTGQPINTTALTEALRVIEMSYNGDRDAKPAAIYADKSPMISSVVVEIATEVYVVPLTTSGEPEFAKAFVAAFPISGRKSKQLLDLVVNPDFCPVGAKYIEVAYSYTGTDKKNAGMDAVLQGCSKDTALATKFPALWEANKDALERLSKTPEAIAGKNMSMSSTTTAKEVIELFKKYVSKNPLTLVHIDYDSDIVKAAAKDFIELGIADDVPNVQRHLLEIVNSQAANTEEEDETLNAKEVIDAAKAKTISELASATEDISKLTGGDVDEIGDIDNV